MRIKDIKLVLDMIDETNGWLKNLRKDDEMLRHLFGAELIPLGHGIVSYNACNGEE